MGVSSPSVSTPCIKIFSLLCLLDKETSHSIKTFWHLVNLIGAKKNAKNLNKMLEVNVCGGYQESIIAGVNF